MYTLINILRLKTLIKNLFILTVQITEENKYIIHIIFEVLSIYGSFFLISFILDKNLVFKFNK